MDRDQLLNDQEEAMRLMLDGRQAGIWTAIPGIIQSIDFDAMTVEVQPSIQGQIEDEDGNITLVNLPLLPDVLLCFPSAGGFTITFPVQIGDEVLVIFSSRCIDAWFQVGGIQPPMESRMHDLSDGFAILGPKSLPKVIGGISSTGVQIRNDAGTTYIELSADGKIKMVTPTEIDITGDLKVSGDVIAGTVSLKNHTHPISVPSTPFTGNTGVPT